MGFDFKKGVAIIAPVTNFEIVGVAIRSVSNFAESAMNQLGQRIVMSAITEVMVAPIIGSKLTPIEPVVDIATVELGLQYH